MRKSLKFPLVFSLGAASLLFAEDPPLAEVDPGEPPPLQPAPETLAQPQPTVAAPEPEATPVEPETPEPQVEVNGHAQGKRNWRVFYHAMVRSTFDDNIFISASKKRADVFTTVAPGVAFGWGEFKSELQEFQDIEEQMRVPVEEDVLDKRNFFFANYTPSATIFVQHDEENSFDHDAIIDGRWQLRRLTLAFESRYQTLTAPNTDVGGRIKSRTFTSEITTRYEVSDKTSVEAHFTQITR